MELSPQLVLQPLRGLAGGGLSARELTWGSELGPARRPRYLSSRAALRQWVARCLGCEAFQVPLHSPPGAPPHLEPGAGFVSLSHSGSMLLLAWSPDPIGVDLESAERPMAAAAIARRFFPPQEWQALQGCSASSLQAAVLRSWVLKEAAIKWRQRSLAEELRFWEYDSGRELLRHLGDGTTPAFQAGVVEGWHWGVVGEGAQSVAPAISGISSGGLSSGGPS
ncbi:MAG: 4'-phosphopantetheinyl transferase superfamily protein [Cyanobacteriota bacterium]|nr:4'-phosphopantetheinyl transferase superfamily protein [Cyanobacteriota bacterium]